jgi:CheY-like chemotaxis protein
MAGATRVLVVDDLPDVRFSFLFMLQALGYDVAEAASGDEALAMISREKIDVVLADLYMPGMDGATLARAIRELPTPRPFIIAMSGALPAGAERSARAAEELAADVVLRKPITRDRLLDAIRSLGSLRRSSDNR